jgi:hypothetical protein
VAPSEIARTRCIRIRFTMTTARPLADLSKNAAVPKRTTQLQCNELSSARTERLVNC